MKKFYTLVMPLLLSLGILAACGNNQEENKGSSSDQTGSQFPITIVDATENEVVVESKPEKIVSLIPSNTEIAYELGLGDEIIAVSDNDNYPEEVADKEKIGGMEFNVEKIISLDPDLVLAHDSGTQTSGEAFQQIRDAGITVLVVNNAQNFDQVYDSIEMIGEATGEKESAEEIVHNMKEEINKIKEKAAGVEESDKKKVFVEVSPAPEIYSTGKNTFMDEMLNVINAENVITEEGWPKVDQEAIIEANPDVIITTYGYYTEDPVGEVTSREGWEDVKAVKNNQVVDVNSDTVTRPGPRLVEGIEELAEAVYPDIFK